MEYNEINYNLLQGTYVVRYPEIKEKTPISQIREIIQEESGLCDIFNKSRKREYVDARRIFYHILRSYHFLGLSQIGKISGNRNHATVLHSLRDFEFLIKSEPYMKALFDRVGQRVFKFKSENQLLLDRIYILEQELLTFKQQENGIYI